MSCTRVQLSELKGRVSEPRTLRWSPRRVFLTLVANIVLLQAAELHAAPVRVWDVDPTQSYFRLTVPDQPVLGLGTVEFRNQDASAWTDAGGRMARVDGLLYTEYEESGPTGSFKLLSQPELFALEERALRPNPAAFNPANTNASNPDGQYGNTTAGMHAFGARLRGNPGVGSVTVAYFGASDVSFNATSSVVPTTGVPGDYYSFSGLDVSWVGSSGNVYYDGLSVPFLGQILPDRFAMPGTVFTGESTVSTGQVFDLGGGVRKLVLPVEADVETDFAGVWLVGSVSGVITAYALIPEPSSYVLALSALVGAALLVRRRR